MNKKTVFLSTLGVLLLIALLRPAHPALALPPRPEPPQPTPLVVGGGIELRVYAVETVDWVDIDTLVQWQDGLGGWHDVDGWRGTLDEFYADGGRKTWFVPQAHFGTGPFRWLLYQGQEILATSEPFDMPEANNQLVRTIVALP